MASIIIFFRLYFDQLFYHFAFCFLLWQHRSFLSPILRFKVDEGFLNRKKREKSVSKYSILIIINVNHKRWENLRMCFSVKANLFFFGKSISLQLIWINLGFNFWCWIGAPCVSQNVFFGAEPAQRWHHHVKALKL